MSPRVNVFCGFSTDLLNVGFSDNPDFVVVFGVFGLLECVVKLFGWYVNMAIGFPIQSNK